MFTVKKIPKTPNIIWDASGGIPLCKFVKGELTTNDEALVSKLESRGYEVSGAADSPETSGTANEARRGRKKSE